MPDLHPIFVAALTGFISGMILCIPVGPVNLTIMNEGARRGFKWAAMIGLGATAMEVNYCTIAFTGFAAFFSKGWIKSFMEVFSFAFMLFLGVRFLIAKQVPLVEKIEHRIEERIEEKLHPSSAFMIGFVRTLANPGVLLGWILFSAYFISRGWVEPTYESKFACIAGVTGSVTLWFVGLSWAISLGHNRFTERTMVKMERASGLGLIILAMIHGGYLAWKLAKHHA
jgi:threonine/homoserine/homoserine lactone efflux protein